MLYPPLNSGRHVSDEWKMPTPAIPPEEYIEEIDDEVSNEGDDPFDYLDEELYDDLPSLFCGHWAKDEDSGDACL